MPDAVLSAAIKEAYASAPADIIYHTLEIWHPAFTVPIRVVRDQADLSARLEAGAPRDAGLVVSFVAFAFDLVPPEVSSAGGPRCRIEIDNVSRDILANIELTVGDPAVIKVIYRAFLQSALLDGPENDPPMEMDLLSISADVFRIRAEAGFNDLANKRFPARDYTSEIFPGLIAQ